MNCGHSVAFTPVMMSLSCFGDMPMQGQWLVCHLMEACP